MQTLAVTDPCLAGLTVVLAVGILLEAPDRAVASSAKKARR